MVFSYPSGEISPSFWYLSEPPRWRPRRDWRRPELGWTKPWSSAPRRRRRSNLTGESGKSVRNLERKHEKYPSCSPKKTYVYTYYCWSMFMYDYHIHLWRSFQPCDWWPVDLSSEKRGFAPTAMFIGWKKTPCPSPRNRGLSEKSSTLWLCQNSYWKWPFIVSFPIKSGDFP